MKSKNKKKKDKKVSPNKLKSMKFTAISRGLLAFTIAALTSILASMAVHYSLTIIIISALLQGLIAVRAFLDTSNSKLNDAVKIQEDKTQEDKTQEDEKQEDENDKTIQLQSIRMNQVK